MKNKICVIGAGVSGLSVANLLKDRGGDVVVYESGNRPGGLIKCVRVEGSLFHTCGGHVFNTKRQDVLDFFWSFFNRDNEFVKAERNSVVFMPDGKRIPYPIENHAYMLDDDSLKEFLIDMTEQQDSREPDNFQDFLKKTFGNTLYDLYFQPYNEKVWRRDLSDVPLSWLEGKLPMPTREEILFNNIRRVEEKSFVHSSFWYEKGNGSQLIADRMADGLDIRYDSPVKSIQKTDTGWMVNGKSYNIVVFCGNIKDLPSIMGWEIADFEWIEKLESHGTTSVFCEIEDNPYSWIYLPDRSIYPHRIICTGNFSPTNNAVGRMTGTIEFTDYISKEDILDQFSHTPLAIKYLTHVYNKYTYPIQDQMTKEHIQNLKRKLAVDSFYFTGRFADWEYYNMDAAMGAAIDLAKTIDL